MKYGLYLFALISFLAHSAESLVELPKFNKQEIHLWEQKVFEGETQYRVLSGENVLEAKSEGAASGLMVKKSIDLKATPYINWRWKIDTQLDAMPEQTKGGDDYVARIYLVMSTGFFPWDRRALNYVWSSSNKMGQHWNNPYAGEKVKMLSVRDASSLVGVWYAEKRNVYLDMIDLFGDLGSEKANLEQYRFIDVVALMTDTDDSGLRAKSYYGPIIFSAQ